MDQLQKSLDILSKYLTDSSEAERGELWAEVKKMGITGPTVEAYLKSIQQFNEGAYTNKYPVWEVVNIVEFKRHYDQAIRNVEMQDHVILLEEIYLTFELMGCSETVNSPYAMAA